jgi:hypothetical protein
MNVETSIACNKNKKNKKKEERSWETILLK